MDQRALLAGAFLAAAAPASAQSKIPDFARSVSANLGLQGRVLWVDATANLDRVTTPEGVADLVGRAQRARFTTIVVDVKPVVGHVLYKSRFATPLRHWRGKSYPDFDVLAAFVRECRKAGLEIAAALNVFSEGHKHFSTGLAYEKRELQSTAYTVERRLLAADGSGIPVRSPADPDEPGKTVVYGDDHLVPPNGGSALSALIDPQGRVEGLVSPALLNGHPLAAPEDGHVADLGSSEARWAEPRLRPGESARFEAQGRLVPVTEAPTERVAAFVSPYHPEARSRQIALLREVAENYDVDALVFDRMRFANLYNDFGAAAREAFEAWLGRKAARWPEDVIAFDPVPGEPMRRGPLYRPWLEFRARTIREFVREATEAVRAVKPSIQFGVYVGSWYPEYYPVGVNWASEKFRRRYTWASSAYHEAGYAEFFDWITTGCYYPVPTRDDARRLRQDEDFTVEAAAELSVAVVQNAAPVYAGLYVLDYRGRPDDFARAISTATRRSQGVMIFDVSHVYEYGWWSVLEAACPHPAAAPHQVPALTAESRAAVDAAR